MENVVNLEQLNYRDQMIKNYIDEHSGGGGTGISAKLALSRYKEDEQGTDTQTIYIGFPENANLDGVTLKFVRNGRVFQRNKAEGISGNKNKWRGFHEVWDFPVKEKKPLFEFSWDPGVEFTKLRYIYHKLLIKNPNGDYVPVFDYIQSKYTVLNRESANNILSHHRGGVVLIKNDEIISGHLQFHTTRNDNRWRLSLY